MNVELKVEAVQTAVKHRTEISPELYAELTANLAAARSDLRALRGGIPCWLSAPVTLAERLDKHLARIQDSIGSIEIVREDSAGGRADQCHCAICKDSLTEKETFIGLCLGCAGELGLDTSEGTPR